MLEIEDLHARYGAVNVLGGINLSVQAHTIVCLLGANGAGKSTTLNCVSGLVKERTGRILFEGEDVSGLSVEKIVERGIVQVPEGREIFRDMTVADNLLVGTWLRRRKGRAARDFDRVFDYFPRLKERASQLAGTLSGGEQQMLMVGRALMAHPKLMLLDEPSLGLSPVMIEHVFKIIKRIYDEGVAILLVEQNATIALSMSSYGYVMENGEIAHQGKSAELSDDPKVQAAYLGGLV